MFDNRSGPLRLARNAIRVAGGLLLALALQAHAVVMPGDKFDFNWTGTSGGAIGLSGTAQLTLGSALTATTFSLSSFDVSQNGGGFCGPCVSLTEVLTGVSFNASTFGLVGHITGTFLGQGGGTHNYDLTLSDIVGGSGAWSFADNNLLLQQTIFSGGTYAPLVASRVDEPAIILLVGLGLVALGILRRRTGRIAPRSREPA